MSYDSRDVNVDQTRLRAQIDKLNNDELKRFLNDDNITTREDLYRIIENLPEVSGLVGKDYHWLSANCCQHCLTGSRVR